MARFTIRVVLHDNATWTEYIQLANALARLGVVDVIASDDGRKWKMPPGEYDYVGTLTASQVLDMCKSAAATTGKRHAVFVTSALERAWAGLDLA